MTSDAKQRVHAVDLRQWALTPGADVLDDDERARADRFATDELRGRFVAAHTALRLVLADVLGIEAREVQFARRACVRCGEPHGRPYVRGAGVTFSLAHSGDVAMVATSEDGEVGIDVEVLRPLRNVLGMARHIADDREVAALAARDDHDRLRAFFELWVRKEAVVKATGEGIAHAKQHSFADGVPDGWCVSEVCAGDHLVAAVAIAGSSHDVPDPIVATWRSPQDALR